MKVVPQVGAHRHGPVPANIEAQVKEPYIRLVMRPPAIKSPVELQVRVFCRAQQAIVFDRSHVVEGFLLGGKNSKIPGKRLVHNGSWVVVNGESAAVNISMQRMVRLRLNSVVYNYK